MVVVAVVCVFVVGSTSWAFVALARPRLRAARGGHEASPAAGEAAVPVLRLKGVLTAQESLTALGALPAADARRATA